MVKLSVIRNLVLCLSFVVAGCSFRPVYATDDSNPQSSRLASVRVENVSGREGQVLQAKLEDLLNPSNSAVAEEYAIKISLGKQRRELGIRGDLRVTRYDLKMRADYTLTSLATNQVVDAGNVDIKSSFNRTNSEFSTFVAEEDAAEKASEELAQEIRSRLIYYFSK